MKAIIQTNTMLHARIVVPARSQQAARDILMSQGWVVEATLPGRIGIFWEDPDTVEIIASITHGRFSEPDMLASVLQQALEEA